MDTMVINTIGGAFIVDYSTTAVVISKAVVIIGTNTTAISITAVVIKDFINQN